ncbi:related to NADH-ubiquinone oxidoreductase [Lecanosticta acicola]|uniref:Related to NADH-ubiquinone oxidoreductase n=1 Tax=Lecanosticta acicola TaxID=111012 RepID=A0AAI9EAY0_9PEZI|nr:related to NADH-ubiquinone oxidoreductase [Lecanosticta acicola]
MRAAHRLLASVQRSTQFLQPGAPTGLAGLITHSSPRSTLLYTYHTTLEKLKQFPEHSVYRQSTEALTRHRIGIIESVKPAGLSEWQQRVNKLVEDHPEAFRKVPIQGTSGPGEFNIVWKDQALKEVKNKKDEDDAFIGEPQVEGIATEEERKGQAMMARDLEAEAAAIPRIESEPALTVEQVNEIESKIGAGLIEEIIQVAEGESKLVDIMLENKVWEDLEEKPQANQWSYFERDTHTGKTQAP